MVPKTQDGGIDGAKNLRWWYRWWYRWCYRWCLRKVRWWYRWCYRWCLRFWLLVVRSIGTIYTTIYRVLAPPPPWRRTQRYLAGLSRNFSVEGRPGHHGHSLGKCMPTAGALLRGQFVQCKLCTLNLSGLHLRCKNSSFSAP